MSKRLLFVDVARALAIGLALFSHAMIAFDGWATVDADWVRILTRTATPLFVFMFGMMLELVYARRAARDGVGSIVPRLFKRSFQCYLGYALTVAAGLVGGYLTIPRAARALVFLDNAHFGNILRLYAVALAFSPAFLWARVRHGLGVPLALLGVVWVLDFVVLDPLSAQALPLNAWAGVLLGTGSSTIGPSVLHGSTFILAGVLVAAGLAGWREAGPNRFYAYAGAALAVCVVVAMWLALGGLGLAGVVDAFVDYSKWRGSNHLGYYAVGTALCLLTLLVLSAVVPRDRLPTWSVVPLQFGQASLFSYTAANVLLNLVPRSAVFPPRWGPVLAGAFVVVMLVLVNWRRIWGAMPPRRLFALPRREAP